jgi:hypothetical protein
VEALRVLMNQAQTYDELKSGLAGLMTAFDEGADQHLIEQLALSGFLAQGLGNGGPTS